MFCSTLYLLQLSEIKIPVKKKNKIIQRQYRILKCVNVSYIIARHDNILQHERNKKRSTFFILTYSSLKTKIYTSTDVQTIQLL